MSVIFGSARNGEKGASGNAAGDQTGSEVSTQEYYTHSKGWYGFAPKSADVGTKLAQAMQDACDNNNIGYDQADRDSLLTQYKKYGSIKAIATKCECDCSSLVRVCIYQATGTLLSDFTTASEPDVLASSGLFESKKSITSASQCSLGMVLVTCSKGHTGIICSGASSSGSTSSGSGTSSTSSTKVADAQYGPDNSVAGTYTVTASPSLNIRYGPSKSYDVRTTVAKGGEVQCHGYYSKTSGVKWLYVVANGLKGYASSEYLSKKSSGSTTTTSSSLPTYKVGNTYKTQVSGLAVRTSPEVKNNPSNRKVKSQLTDDGKKHSDSEGYLNKNTTVTCKATRTNGGDVWMEIPSGWVAAYYGGKKYIG